MNNIQRLLLRTAAAAVIAGLSAPAFAVDFNVNIELDNTYLANKSLNGVTTQKRGLEQSGRVEFNASGKIGDDTFIAGRGTLIEQKGGAASIDDMWFQLGSKSFDVKLGRFEATALFPVPADVLVNFAGPGTGVQNPYSGTAPYLGSTLRGRLGNSGNYGQGEFHAAATFKSDFGLAFELGAVEFKQTDQIVPAPTPAQPGYPDAPKGFRPIVSYKSDALSLTAGAEIIKYGNGNSETGFGATVGYDFGPYALNGSAAFGKDASAATGVSANKLTTYGITGTSIIGLAGGVILGKNELGTGTEDGKTTTIYASYTHSLFDFKGATWSLGACSSTVGGGYKDHYSDDKGMRLRFDYTF